MKANNYYTRMFPKLERFPSTPESRLEEGLKELGACMKDDSQAGNGEVDAGATYLGQFIDHDLTLDLTPLADAHPSAEQTRNFRTPFLDLDHVYGGGPNLSPFLYEITHPPGNERFLIGWTKKVETDKKCFASSPDDLPRNVNGIALVSDPRQDENLILAQLHVAFLKIHNHVMDALANCSIQSVGPEGATLFEQTRRLVTWHYQYVVLHDFLANLISADVLASTMKGCRSWGRAQRGRFSIPIEFSVAAFRFGHSMVRDSYTYNDTHRDVKLSQLLKQTGIGGGAVPGLPADWVIKWDNFFGLSGHPTPALKIDTTIAAGLHDLQIDTVKLYRVPPCDAPPQLVSPKNILPVRTLWRGARVGLPSGQDVAEAMCIEKPLMGAEISPGLHEAIITKYGFHKDTPLWYYILKEAESARFGGGLRLGPVGSRLIANVIIGALVTDPNSYLSIDPAWQPILLDQSGQPTDTMSALLSFVLSPPVR